MIKIENIHKTFGNLEVLKGVNLTIEQGKIVSIVGASGAGKSTLLQIIGTLDKPNCGSILINDIDVFKLNDRDLSLFRNKHIGFVFQFHHLLPEFTALENVCIPAFINKISKAEAEKRAIELLSSLGLKDRMNHKPSELSGGEAQRVAVCRALINKPTVVLADEPSGNLDSNSAKELHELFFKLRELYNQTFVIVTHNEDLSNMADVKLIMKDGIIL
ncbi:MAG: ABC transporter ATP-binding protein [Flavobacteriales bacterium]|nr:ABC transporter ATP-binding protein [Flavobacteriales bacterium]